VEYSASAILAALEPRPWARALTTWLRPPAIDAGWKVLFVPAAQVVHHGGQSARQVLAEATLYRYRSLGAFYRKHYPAWHLTVLKAAIGVAVMMRLAVYSSQPSKRAAFSAVLRHLRTL